jgi:hypothetical protein
MAEWEKDRLRKLYKGHVNSAKFILTKRQRLILLGLRKREKGTTESDLWYRIRNQVRKGLLDLELFASVANEEQLKEVFAPLTVMEHRKLDLMFGAMKLDDAKKMQPDIMPGYNRTDLSSILERLLKDGKTQTEDDEYWRYRLASDMVRIGREYLLGR